MSKLSLVTAIYKNEKNIIPFYENFISEIAPYLDDYEIIMVNDRSPDGSWQIMKDLAQKDKHIKVVLLSRNFGAYEANYIGYTYATGDCVTVKAVDLQEPPELTIEMYNEWKKGANVVLAVREGRNDSALSNLFANVYYGIIRKFVQPRMPRHGFDTYLVDKKVVNHIVNMRERNSPISLQILWAGYDIQFVSYIRRKRDIGKSSWTFGKKFKLVMDSIISFSYVPVRFMSCCGAIALLGSLVYSIYLVIARIIGRVSLPGFTTIIVALLFFSGLIMFTLGILGEYIWRVLENSRERPIAIVEETHNIDDTEEDKND